MPRPKIEAAFLGHYTLTALDCANVRDAGWLCKALTAWILRDQEPDEESIPPNLRALWTIIHDESVAIHDARKQQREAGAKGGKANGKRTESETEANDERTGTKIEKKIEKKIYTEEPLTRAPARTHAPANGGQRSAVDISSRDSSAVPAVEDKDTWEMWAREVRDPVDVALSATGEGASKRPVYGKLLRDLGDADLFREACILFAADWRAGDPMRNRGAVLVRKLKQEIADEKAAKARMT